MRQFPLSVLYLCAVHCGPSWINCGFDPDMYYSILNMTRQSRAQSLHTFRQHIFTESLDVDNILDFIA
jgi:hypothetical protein